MFSCMQANGRSRARRIRLPLRIASRRGAARFPDSAISEAVWFESLGWLITAEPRRMGVASVAERLEAAGLTCSQS